MFNSVESSGEDIAKVSQRIQSAVTAECECTIKTSDESNHCHEICRTDVSKAVAKLKSDKISDNGLVYSNNFIVLYCVVLCCVVLCCVVLYTCLFQTRCPYKNKE